MSIVDLIRRTLLHFRASNIAVIAGVIAATATIGGALIVGDSVRGSLRQMTLDRLGQIEELMTGPRFLTKPTVEIVADDAIPAILLLGTTKANNRIAGSVQIVGLPSDAMPVLWPGEGISLREGELVLNQRVAASLDVTAGDEISLLMELPATVPRDSLLGERDEVLIESLFKVGAVLPAASGAGRFSISPAQQIPSVVFLPLADLQQALDIDAIAATRRTAGRVGRVNTLIRPLALPGQTATAGTQASDTQSRLAANITLADVDLSIVATPDEETFSVESRQQILSDATSAAIIDAAKSLDGQSRELLVYLINELAQNEDPTRFSTYSVAAGVESFDGFTFVGPPLQRPLDDDEVVVNAWLADDLGVSVGDEIALSYLEVGDTGDLPEVNSVVRVAALVAMEGAATDRTLTPTVPGITDADTFSDWEQPYTMDLSRVTDRDEDYWDLYRATPKIYFSLKSMQNRFASRYGDATSIRVSGTRQDELRDAILQKLDLPAIGFAVRNIRRDQLAAAAGTTDFSGLFIGFSLFLIASALLLIGLLFRLGIEQRITHLGLLRAIGWKPARVQKVLVGEGVLLAVLGGLLGVAAAVAYAAAMLYGLTTWWGSATGTQFLTLHVTPTSLLVGFCLSVGVSLATMWTSVRRLNRETPKDLLAGIARHASIGQKPSRRSSTVAMISLTTCGLLLIGLLLRLIPDAEAFAGFSWPTVAFFVCGTCGLIGGIALFASRLGSGGNRRSFGLLSLGWQNIARAKGRSVLTVSLISSATFLLVAVAVARKDPTAEEPNRDSGNGGYRIVAETATPILTDIATQNGRFDAQFLQDPASDIFRSIGTTSLRLRPGDDASCLNLYSARLPTLLGIPEAVLRQWDEEGRFRFADTPSASPWLELLSKWQGGEGDSVLSIPVLGDMNTLLYSLHKGIGQSVDVPVEVHPNATLDVRGMLDGSVFQGMLLMSDENLRRLDPTVVGFRYFLVESDVVAAEEATSLLEAGFADYGFDAEPVADRIADFLAVQNTYLTTFQALGGLGLLLGTIGLGTVMLRNVVERSSELALMRAVGFRQRRVAWMIVGENALLLTVGLAIGAIAALCSMSPHITSTGADVPWIALAGLLFAVFIVGMATACISVRQAAKMHVLDALKSE